MYGDDGINGDDDEDDDCVVVDDNGLVVAIFHTKSAAETIQSSSSPNATTITSDDDEEVTTTADSSADKEPEHFDDLAHMSHALDSLGWKKVFVDLRNEIPIGVTLPRLSSPLSFPTPSFFDSSSSKRQHPTTSTNNAATTTAAAAAVSASSIPMLKRQGVVMASRDVASATSIDLSRLSWPLGHNMIVAFSRDQKSATFNKGGRPVVDALANELVEFIFSWEKK